MDLRIGTSGFSYKAWKGPFYPADLPAGQMLRFYAGQLPSVEINNTFYRLPKVSVLEGWDEQVPRHFRFALKASRRITHFKRLKAVEDETAYLLRTTASLGARLGVLLFQLPPNAKLELARLEAFAELLPEGFPAAFEFRHPSWLTDPVLELLRQRNFALVGVDAESADASEITRTASWGYLRLRREGYDRSELSAWVARIVATGWREVFVFFKHEDAGAAPALARQFLELAARAEKRKRPRRKGEPDTPASEEVA